MLAQSLDQAGFPALSVDAASNNEAALRSDYRWRLAPRQDPHAFSGDSSSSLLHNFISASPVPGSPQDLTAEQQQTIAEQRRLALLRRQRSRAASAPAESWFDRARSSTGLTLGESIAAMVHGTARSWAGGA